ncbi:hypothetical protein BDSB_11660 [Burkholderia dolosa PC543]|nr:hypothetical protein BDSB_11660 [Burkholderia dolosa PC543]
MPGDARAGASPDRVRDACIDTACAIPHLRG